MLMMVVMVAIVASNNNNSNNLALSNGFVYVFVCVINGIQKTKLT